MVFCQVTSQSKKSLQSRYFEGIACRQRATLRNIDINKPSFRKNAGLKGKKTKYQQVKYQNRGSPPSRIIRCPLAGGNDPVILMDMPLNTTLIMKVHSSRRAESVANQTPRVLDQDIPISSRLNAAKVAQLHQKRIYCLVCPSYPSWKFSTIWGKPSPATPVWCCGRLPAQARPPSCPSICWMPVGLEATKS